MPAGTTTPRPARALGSSLIMLCGTGTPARPTARAAWRRLACRASGQAEASTTPAAPASGQAAASSAPAAAAAAAAPVSAADVARRYYEGYNSKRFDDVLELIAEDCVYEDLIYQDPFVGKPAIAAYLQKVAAIVPDDVLFVVEDITEGGRKAGVRWHVELEGGIEFPFSRGVSFYEINEEGKIVFARDIVEPAMKPGGAALKGITVVAPLVRKLGPKANPSYLKQLPLAAAGMFAFYAAYVGYVMVGTAAPGLPAWQTSMEQLAPVLHESLNFFYINVGLAAAGLNPVPSIAEHPVDEALFNFVNAWSLMFWPAMLADPRGRRVGSRAALWVGTMFLTNVFMLPYMALRLAPDASEDNPTSSGGGGGGVQPGQPDAAAAPGLPAYAPLFGAVGATIGVVSLVWAVAARPEYGDLLERWEFFQTMFSSNRVFWAFCLDSGLYAVWQATLLGAAGAAGGYRWVPFAGLAAWLLRGGPVAGRR